MVPFTQTQALDQPSKVPGYRAMKKSNYHARLPQAKSAQFILLPFTSSEFILQTSPGGGYGW